MQDPKRTIRSRRRSRGRPADGEPNKIDLHVGGRIRLKRQTLGWSQEYLGNLLGLTFQQVQKYEKGLNRVSASRLYDFACLLGVDANFFYQDMPEDARRESPRYIATGFAAPADGEDNVAGTFDPLKSERAMKLLRMFLKIPNRQIADRLFDFLETLSLSAYISSKRQNTPLQPQETDNAEDR